MANGLAARLGMTPVQLRGMIAAIAAVSIFAFSLSLSIPLISINLERMGASGFLIGLNSSASAVAILAGGFVMPVLLRRFSAPSLMLTGVLSMTLLLPLFPLWPDPYYWLVLRFIFGMMVTALFFCSELWIISTAPDDRRGLLIGVYGMFLAIGFLVGPLLLKVVGTEGWAPFLTGAALSLVALPPILWAWRDAPNMAENAEEPPGVMAILRYVRTDPAIVFAVMLFAVIEFGAMGLFPVWSLRVGLPEQTALTLVALLAAGNILMQPPMGWLGDKLDRRRLLGFCAFVSIIAAFLFPALAQTQWPLWLTALFWGGLVVGLYTFSLNELGARYNGEQLSRATGAVMAAYGFGALISPTALGLMMDLFPPHGLFYLMAALAAAYLAMLLLRRRRTG
ncbi:MAG: MFS transporter [Pseudomonadota bacterium]